MTDQVPRPAVLAPMLTMIAAAVVVALGTWARAETILPPAKPAQLAEVGTSCGKEFTFRKVSETSYNCTNTFEVRCREGYSAQNPTLRRTKGNYWAVSYRCEKDAVPR